MKLTEDTLQVETPENVAFGYQIAGIGSRFLAALVDTLLITVIQIALGLLGVLAITNLVGDSLEAIGRLGAWLLALGGLLAFAIYWGYYIFFELIWNGQSPGKRLVGLRVIRSDGAPITLAESTIRNLVRLVDFLPAYYGIGVIVMFVNEQSRRLGDLVANTLVVRDRGPLSLASLEVNLAPTIVPENPAPGEDWPVERLTAADLQIAEDFLRRQNELFNRDELAQRIRQTLLERMSFPFQPATGDEAKKWIGQIARAARSRQAGGR